MYFVYLFSVSLKNTQSPFLMSANLEHVKIIL